MENIGLPLWLCGKESACNAGDGGDGYSIPELERFPGEGDGNPLREFLPGKFYRQRSLVGYSLWGPKELDTTHKWALTHSLTHAKYALNINDDTVTY